MKLNREYYLKLQELTWLGEDLKKFLLIKNILDEEKPKRVLMDYDPFDKDWRIIEIEVEKHPIKKYWKHWITIHIEPNDDVNWSNIEVDIDDNRTLTNLDDIIKFFNDIHLEDYTKGIKEIEEKME